MTGALETLGLFSGFLAIIAAVPYIRDILKGQTCPERISWLIWSSLSVIALASQLAQGSTWGLGVTVGDTLATISIFGLSIKYGVGGWTKRDITALVVALAGLGAWLVSRQPITALLAVVVADLSGSVLTIRKAYESPETETLSMWVLVALSGVLGAISVGREDLRFLVYPLYLAATNGAVGIAIVIGRNRRAR